MNLLITLCILFIMCGISQKYFGCNIKNYYQLCFSSVCGHNPPHHAKMGDNVLEMLTHLPNCHYNAGASAFPVHHRPSLHDVAA